MIARMRKLARNERGAVIIELAMVAPVFALMVVGIVDLSNGFARKLVLEQGAQRAIEKVMQTTGETTVADTIRHEVICQVNGVDADGVCGTSPIADSDVTVTYRLECTDGAGVLTSSETEDADIFDAAACATGSAEARYLQVLVENKYTPMFPIHFAGIDADNTYHLSATAGMRTK